MIEFFERRRKGVALTPAGKSFLIDARRILEDCDSIKKAQRISRGEMGELAIGNMSALTPDFLGKALEVRNRGRLHRDGFRFAEQGAA
jgi:DNA-binding transcriptional LysR family regulator